MGRRAHKPDPKPRRSGRSAGRPSGSGKTGRKRKTSGRKLTLFESASFVAWDGEGVQTERGHRLTMLSAAWRAGDDWVYRELTDENGLATSDVLRFMLDVSKQAPARAVHVGYYLTYDITQILRDLTAQQAAYALAAGRRWGRLGAYEVKVKHREFWVRERIWVEKDGKRERHTVASIRIWDVAAFFQSSFVKAIKAWLGDYPELEMIVHGKAGRDDFSAWSMDAMLEYNRAELRALVLLVERLRDSIVLAGYKPSRFDGAGALASAFFKRHMQKTWFKDARIRDENVLLAAASAYFGGRIEYIQYGHYTGYLWDGDINSAYPAALSTIPDLARGRWLRGDRMDIKDFALYRVRWAGSKAGIGLFPFRLKNRNVLFPHEGEGWVWGIELIAAVLFLGQAGSIEILDEYYFQPDDPEARPFGWVRDVYQKRLELVRKAKAGDQRAAGEQKVLKLGLNALYGKTVQHVGYSNPDLPVIYRYNGVKEIYYEQGRHKYPPYYNLAIGGYITAYTRAKLLHAARSDPGAVISFMTDGLLAIRPLDVDTSADKELGKWSVEEFENAWLIQVQPGVYYIHDGQHWIERCRGFRPAALGYMDQTEADRAIQERVNQILEAFRAVRRLRGNAAVVITEKRFVTLKQALATDYDKRGEWLEADRVLRVYNSSAKRVHSGSFLSPAKHLVPTAPRSVWYFQDELISLPYDALPPDTATQPASDEIADDELYMHALDQGEV